MTKADPIQTISDRMAITDLLYCYCRSVDRIDHQLGYSIWNPGSIADYGEFYRGDGPGVIDLICSQHQHLLSHTHQMSNILIVINGDQASSESYITATLRLEKDKQLLQMTVWSRYVDSWSRHAGRWGLDKRIAVRDFDEIRPVTPMTDGCAASRNRNDPSYAALPSTALTD